MEEFSPSDWPGGKCVEHFLDKWLMWESSAHCGQATLAQVVFGCLRKTADQAMASASIPDSPSLTSLQDGL